MTLDAHAAIRARRTIHDYATTPVDEAAVRRALEAAHTAPCHKLTWPWRFIRVGPAGRERLLALNTVLKNATTPETLARLRSRMLNPPVLFALTQVLAPDPDRQKEDYAACACAAQNLAISLAADGIGTKWTSGRICAHPDTHALLGVDPAREAVIGMLWIGYPGREHRAPARPPLVEVLREIP